MRHLVVLSNGRIHDPGLGDFPYYVAEATALEVPETDAKRAAGPEVVRLPKLTTEFLNKTGGSRPVRTVLTALSDGSLLAPADAEIRGPSVHEWLETVQTSG